MDMQTVIAREGREAKNLWLYHLSSEDEINTKKPPTHVKPLILNRKLHAIDSKSSNSGMKRVRSASTGRDKRSELQARYWALLLSNLQRAINDIYQTVECYENLASCQEAILVLENYIRDFRALAEWFRVSWDYDSTPQPQRPQFLAWEVRKSNPVPSGRAKSLSSPSPQESGKSSPCPSYSGKSSPCPIAEDGKTIMSPRNKILDIKTNIALTSKPLSGPKSPRLHLIHRDCKISMSDIEGNSGLVPINENDKSISNDMELTKIPEENNPGTWADLVEQEEIQTRIQPPQIPEDKCLLTFDQYSQTSGFIEDYLTLQQWREKYQNGKNDFEKAENPIEAALFHTTNKLNEMENQFLNRNTNQSGDLIQTKAILPSENELSKGNLSKAATEQLKRAIVSGNGTVLPDAKKIQTGVQKKMWNSNNRTSVAPILRQLPNKINAVKTVNLSIKPANVSNIVVNTNLIRKFPAPIKPVTSPHITKANRTIQKDSVNRDALRRPIATTRTNGIPSNTASRLAARSKTMIDLGKNNSNHYSMNAGITKAPSKDSIASSTSTLRASNDRISDSQNKLNGLKSQPRNLPTKIEDDDGWLTVKARRRSSFYWSNRFNQPSGYASLPTLSLFDEKDSPNAVAMPVAKKVTKPVGKPVKSEPTIVTHATATSKSTVISSTMSKSSTSIMKIKSKTPNSADDFDTKSKTDPIKTTAEDKQTTISRTTALQRQKSDITGLKLNNLRKEYFRSEKMRKMKDSKKETPDDATNEQQKVSMNIQTAGSGLSVAMCDLYSSCLVDGKPTDDNIFNKPDNEDNEENESDENQRKLLEEQECLERQIFELQNTEIEIDTETDDADCETILGLEEIEENDPIEMTDLDQFKDNSNLEAQYQHLLSDMTSGERIQTLATLQAYVSRHPGRAQQLHQKLSSPSRRRSLHETLKKYQAKQERARDMRETLNKEKALKLQALLARVEDVKTAKQNLIEEKRLRMQEKLQRYAENRNQYLKDKVRKAHDEEEKLKEIAFIKSLEAQNKLLDFQELRKGQEKILENLEQERQRRVEDKAAKEAAVERRRLELAKERQKRLERIDESRRNREQRLEQKQEEKEKMRQKIMRDKARDREERLLALQVQEQKNTEELQRKIIQKQQESARRHEETIEHIRQRAQELSIPSKVPTAVEDDLSSIVTLSDAPVDKTKATKKKLKKIRLRMAQLKEEYINEFDHKVPLYMKNNSCVPKILALMRRGGGPQGMERPLGQLTRIAAKPEVYDFQCLWLMDGLGVLAEVIKNALEPNSELSRKSLIMAIQIYRDLCSPCIQIARHAVLGNSILTLFDSLLHSLQKPDEKTASHPIELSTELMLACTVVLSPFNTLKQPHPKVLNRLPDIVWYAVSIGLIDVLSKRCIKIHEPIETHQSVVLSILACLGLLTKFADICPRVPKASKFLSVVKTTDLFGAISLLYATIVPVGEGIPPRTISIAAATFNLILTIANLDFSTFQSILNQESLSLQFLDVVTILLKYCGPKSSDKGETQAVVVDLVATLGFFCANNKQNQNLLTNNQWAVIIKSLSKLPKTFDIVVYPTLITIIRDNDDAKNVIGRDFDLKCIEEYEKSDSGQKNKMLRILQPKSVDKKKTLEKKLIP